MKDHNYVDDSGKRTPIAQLSTEFLHELLRGRIYIHESADAGVTVADVKKRIEIELIIRRNGWRV